MKKTLISLATIILTATFVAGTVHAQEKKDATPPAAPATPAKKAMPVAGKLSAVDTNAKTVSLSGKSGDRVFQITSKTKIIKDGKPATLEDAKVGDEVGIYALSSDGKFEALSLRIGAKPAGAAKHKKEKKQ